jgi:hypothetical protein
VMQMHKADAACSTMTAASLRHTTVEYIRTRHAGRPIRD